MDQENGRKEQGRFEGQVMTRLDLFERQNRETNKKLDDLDGKITKLQINVGVGKGLVAVIAALVSLATTFATSIFKGIVK